MPPVPNPRVVFAKIPVGTPVPGEDTVYDASRTIDLENVPLNGGFLTKTLVMAIEPYYRGRMRDKNEPSYSTPYKLGETITGSALVVVLRSEDPQYKRGDYLFGMTTWEAYTVQPYIDGRWANYDPKEWPAHTFNVDSFSLQKVSKLVGIPWTTFVGSFGTPWTTAYCGLQAYAHMKKGETLFVSAGAGAVGSMVVQLAKLSGLKVIASAGSDEKVKYLTSDLGADVAFNYKTANTGDVLAKHGPVDIYWDNVGGPTFESAIDHAALHGRIVICGQVSEYNVTDPNKRYGIKNTVEIFKKRLTVYGLLVGDLIGEYGSRFFAEIPKLVLEGKLKTKEHVWHGLENADKALVAMLAGENVGQSVVVVAEE